MTLGTLAANLVGGYLIGVWDSEEGMTLFDAHGDLHVSAQAREVFDVTGAGDTVIATMAALVGAGMSLREALPLANRAGGLVVWWSASSVQPPFRLRSCLHDLYRSDRRGKYQAYTQANVQSYLQNLAGLSNPRQFCQRGMFGVR